MPRRLFRFKVCLAATDLVTQTRRAAAPPAGLSAEPYVSGVVRLGEQQGGILLIASDGLWDVTDAEAVTAAVCQADK